MARIIAVRRPAFFDYPHARSFCRQEPRFGDYARRRGRLMRRLLAIRHLAFEDLGSFETVARARGFEPAYVAAPDLVEGRFPWQTADPLVVLGGPIGVGDGAQYPCIGVAIDGLRERLRNGRPTLGICLGAQLMAAALGASVRYSGAQHVGWSALEFGPDPGPLAGLAGVPVLHWHGDTFDVPPGARLLAGTAAVPHQAFDIPGQPVLALQFHPEVEASGLEHWLIGHHRQLSDLGIAPDALRAQAARHAAAMTQAGDAVFGDWLDRAAPA